MRDCLATSVFYLPNQLFGRCSFGGSITHDVISVDSTVWLVYYSLSLARLKTFASQILTRGTVLTFSFSLQIFEEFIQLLSSISSSSFISRLEVPLIREVLWITFPFNNYFRTHIKYIFTFLRYILAGYMLLYKIVI